MSDRTPPLAELFDAHGHRVTARTAGPDASLLVILSALVWWAFLLTLLAYVARWTFTRDGDDVFPVVQAVARRLERISWITVGCFLLWLVLWLGDQINSLST